MVPPLKHKKSKNQLVSHCMAAPEYFDSSAEAIASAHSLITPRQFTTSDKSELEPEIVLSMLYNEKTASLTVTILCITNLELKLSDPTHIQVQAFLRPRYHQKQMTQAVSSVDAEFNECFYFDRVRTSDLDASHLLLTVNKIPGNKRVAEVFMTLASLKIEYGKTLHFKFPLIMEPRSKRVS